MTTWFARIFLLLSCFTALFLFKHFTGQSPPFKIPEPINTPSFVYGYRPNTDVVRRIYLSGIQECLRNFQFELHIKALFSLFRACGFVRVRARVRSCHLTLYRRKIRSAFRNIRKKHRICVSFLRFELKSANFYRQHTCVLICRKDKNDGHRFTSDRDRKSVV